MNNSYRADHLGSLLRPAELLAARTRFTEGSLDQHELNELEDRAIIDVLD